MHKETLYHIGTEIVVMLVAVAWFQYQNHIIHKKIADLEDINDDLQNQIKILSNIVKSQSSQLKHLMSQSQPLSSSPTYNLPPSSKNSEKLSQSKQSSQHFISVIQLDQSPKTISKPTITEVTEDLDTNTSDNTESDTSDNEILEKCNLDNLISSELSELK